MRAPLDDPEEGLIGPAVRLLASPGPGDRPADGIGDDRLATPAARAMIQAHGHVGPEGLLDGHGALRRQLQQAAVDVRAERDSRVGHAVARRQAEDLEPARVGQDRAVPAHESVQPARSRPRRPRRAAAPGGRCWRGSSATRWRELVGGDPLDRRLGADRHEGRRLHRAMRRLEQAGPRRTSPGRGPCRRSGPAGTAAPGRVSDERGSSPGFPGSQKDADRVATAPVRPLGSGRCACGQPGPGSRRLAAERVQSFFELQVHRR